MNFDIISSPVILSIILPWAVKSNQTQLVCLCKTCQVDSLLVIITTTKLSFPSV